MADEEDYEPLKGIHGERRLFQLYLNRLVLHR